ncbi:MAG: RAMP superfamily CRISPR-associated protein [Pyrobaculum sp.]
MSSVQEYTFTVRAASPTSVGWYEPNLTDKRFYLRPTSLKGVWRWWARAVVAGVLYDAGQLNCNEDGRCRMDNKEIGSILGELGLGAGGERAVASKLKIEVEILKRPKDCKYEDKTKIPPFFIRGFIGGEFKIKLRGYYVSQGQDVLPAVKLFLLATTLGGVGKGSRRGRGSLDVMNTNLKIGGDIVELLDDIRNNIAKFLNVNPKGGQHDLAPVTLISKSNTEIYRIKCNDRADHHSCYKPCLIAIRNFFVTTERREKIGRDPLRDKTNDWILGLPRKEYKDSKRSKRPSRRPSPFILSYHEKHIIGDKDPHMYLTVIKSRDWPKELEWSEGSGSNILIDDNTLRDAYRSAIDAFNDYVSKLGYKVKRIWP